MAQKKQKESSTAILLEQMKKLVRACNKDLDTRNSLALSHNKYQSKNKKAKKNPYTNKLDKCAQAVIVKMEQIALIERKVKETPDFDLYQNKLNAILSNYILTKNNYATDQTKVQHTAKGRKENLASKPGRLRGRNS